MSNLKKIAEYDIEDIGLEHSQYFQGRGVCGTRWDNVAVGIGNSQREAFEDALEELAYEYDVSALEAELSKASDFDEVKKHLEDNAPAIAKAFGFDVIEEGPHSFPYVKIGAKAGSDENSNYGFFSEYVAWRACCSENDLYSRVENEVYYHVAVYIKESEAK